MAQPPGRRDTGAVKTLLLFGLVLVGCAAEPAEPASTEGTSDEIVGGEADLRWPAAGYLVHAGSREELAAAKPACGATLVSSSVVVTAAHCVLAAADDVWAFGTGNVGSAPLTLVASRRIHPDFHPEPQGRADVRYYLRNFDLATLQLDTPLDLPPAPLAAAKPPVGCNYLALGYQQKPVPGIRVSTSACVELNLSLGGDPIFEVHPTGFSALCHADGDEGSALFSPDGTLHGIYVGSVTQGLTDCHRGTQFLDGYEAMYGFRDFVDESIALAE